MIDLLAAISLISDMNGLIDSIRRSETKNRRSAKEVVSILREIYFVPRGVKLLLEKISNDERPSEDEVSSILVDFNDVEDRVRVYARRAQFNFEKDFPGLNLKQLEALNMISWAKINLRKEIQQKLNVDWFRESKLPTTEASRLLGEINSLNAVISELEEELRS